jgi:hypothetical protein
VGRSGSVECTGEEQLDRVARTINWKDGSAVEVVDRKPSEILRQERVERADLSAKAPLRDARVAVVGHHQDKITVGILSEPRAGWGLL